jgi:hypothetical protein
MSKSINPMYFLYPEGEPLGLRPRSHRLDEFAAGYSLAGCSPALPASASPAGLHFQTNQRKLSTVTIQKIEYPLLDLKRRSRQNINTRGGPN